MYRSTGAFVLGGCFSVLSIRLIHMSSLHLELLTFHVRNMELQFVFPDKVATQKKICQMRMVLKNKLWGYEH